MIVIGGFLQCIQTRQRFSTLETTLDINYLYHMVHGSKTLIYFLHVVLNINTLEYTF